MSYLIRNYNRKFDYHNVFLRQSWLVILIPQLCSNPKEKDRLERKCFSVLFLAPQDAIEVMLVTDLLTHC